MLSYLAVGIILSQGFALISSSFDGDAEQSSAQTNSVESTEEIISDEVDLTAAPEEAEVAEVTSEEIISDEAGLEELEVEEIEYVSPVEISPEAGAMALDISNQELLRLFIENKSRLQGTGNGEVDYDDFVDAWKEMTSDYGNKGESLKLLQKQAFIEIYLRLTWGTK